MQIAVNKSRRIVWQMEPESLIAVKRFFDRHRDDPFVLRRIERNLCAETPAVAKGHFWFRLIACLLTSQQKSGPDSPVGRFLRTNPFPLDLEACRRQFNVDQFAIDVLSAFRGLRRHKVVANQVSANLDYLENGGWSRVLTVIDELRLQSTPQAERRAARDLDDLLKGFGPKQSRSLLQQLGLSRFEVPIDSCMTKWLNDIGFPIDGKRLTNRDYFESAVDGFQHLAKACGVAPCVLDAAIFASVDEGAWTEQNVL